jgi:hypothetical protein
MKKAILVLLFSGFAVSLDAQQTENPVMTKTDYLKKAKGQKIGAWCTLGGGLAMGVAGIAINLGAPWDGEHVNSGVWMVYVGAAAVITSIPLFISAGKNKRRAAALAFTSQPVYGQWPGMNFIKAQPAVQIKLGLGNKSVYRR